MKKIFIAILAVIMALSASFYAFAEGEIPGASKDVTVALVDTHGNPVTYERTWSVEVTFSEALDQPFEWQANAAKDDIVWNPDAHRYTTKDGGDIEWTIPKPLTDAIVIKNHSSSNLFLYVTLEDYSVENMAPEIGSGTQEDIHELVHSTMNVGLKLTGTQSEGAMKERLLSAAAVAYGNPDAADTELLSVIPFNTPTSIPYSTATVELTTISILLTPAQR